MNIHFTRRMLTGLALMLSMAVLPATAATSDDDIDLFTPELTAKVTAPRRRHLSEDRWSLLLPAFVVHGTTPTGGANQDMPRRLDDSGRAVETPGIGFEYQDRNSFDALSALIKDCYDNYAGTLQFGQHFHIFKTTEIGYTLGLYVRQTPLSCTTSTTPLPANGSRGTITSTNCVYEDNLPWRYTVQASGGLMDIIPTPFLNFSTELLHGPIDIHLKLMSNFYLNEVGLAIPF